MLPVSYETMTMRLLSLIPLLLAMGLSVACERTTQESEPTLPGAKQPAAVAHAAGQKPSKETQNTFPVEGMVCEGCQNSIQSAVSKLDGVVSCTASHEQKQAKVIFDPARVKPEQIVAAISELGYRAALPGQPVPAEKP